VSEGIWVPPGGSADPRREEPEPARREDEITPEQLAEAIRQMRISDLLLSTLSTLAQLGYAKLEPASRDLDQARLAIEALRALVPVLEGAVPDEALRDFRQVIANLQLAYASAVDDSSSKEDEGAGPDQG
jgi:phage gp37-like protein